MAEIKRFKPRRDLLRREQAVQLEAFIQQQDPDVLPDKVRDAILTTIARNTDNFYRDEIWEGGFVMLSRNQTAAIWDAIRQLPADYRPNHVRHVFDLAILNLRQDTGEILFTRDELAEKVGADADNISRIMSTLEAMGVVRRERRKVPGMKGPGMAVYFLNPHVAWNGSLDVRKLLAVKEAKPKAEVLPLLRYAAQREKTEG